MENTWKANRHRVSYDPETDIFTLEIFDQFRSDELDILNKIMEPITRDRGGYYRLLIDLANNKFGFMSKEERKKFQQKMQSGDGGEYRVAIINASPALRMFSKILLKISRVRNSGFFKTREEAKKWLMR